MRDAILQRVSRRFDEQFGRPPRWVAAAPGRVNLIGEHTDYNAGFVLPMAIDRYTVVAVDRPRTDDGTIRIFSTAVEETVTFSCTTIPEPGAPSWANYVRGVVAGFQRRGITIGPFDAVIDSRVPVGSGLSSSAALEVATATLLEAFTGQTLPPRDKVLLCQRAEHEYAGVPCGIMDQFISTMARADHALLLDCRSLEVEAVPLTDPDVAVLIANTNVKHALDTSAYAERRRQCEEVARLLGVAALRDATLEQLEAVRSRLDAVSYRRARHVISEIGRTVAAARACTAGDWTTMGQLMAASHVSLRDDFEVSCVELDLLVDLARDLGTSHGVLGSRMTGAGFGGCTVSLVRTAAVPAIQQRFHEGYLHETGIMPTIFATRPADGACVLARPD